MLMFSYVFVKIWFVTILMLDLWSSFIKVEIVEE